MNSWTIYPFLKQKIHSLFNINKLYIVEHTHVKYYFTQVFRKVIFFSTLVKRSGGEGVLSWTSGLTLIFEGGTSGFLSQLLGSTFHFKQAISQLSCRGSTLGRQNSRGFGLPGCKFRLLLILYHWGKMFAILTCILYMKNNTRRLQTSVLKVTAASISPGFFIYQDSSVERNEGFDMNGSRN